MRKLKHFFDKNRAWAQKINEQDPVFFEALSKQQSPEYLWIGCSDSRVPANQIVDMLPGEIFVHRNIANLVIHTDMNCLSVMQYAVDVLKVKHIIVCGHYGCGGIKAAMMRGKRFGLIDNWIRHIQDIITKHKIMLDGINDQERLFDKICEINVIEQVFNVCLTTIVQDAWLKGQDLSVHGWIYRVSDGLLQDLGVCITNYAELMNLYHGKTIKGFCSEISDGYTT